MRERALQAYRLLNDMLLDLLVGPRSIELYDSSGFTSHMTPVTLTGLKRMTISHTIVSLAKWVEFYDRYKQVIPQDVREQAKALSAEILRRGVRDFRNKVVGHIWDDDAKRPLLREEIDSYFERMFPNGRRAFMLWVNDPADQVFPNTVVSVVQKVRDRIAEEHAITEQEVFKPGHRGKWENGAA